MRDYRKIGAWAEADAMAVAVYEYTRSFPPDEAHGLRRDLRRRAHSVPTCIAKGAVCESIPDYLDFLHQARCALIDTDYSVRLAAHLGYLGADEHKVLKALIRSTAVRLDKMIEEALKRT
jgi:four helix bundle protein